MIGIVLHEQGSISPEMMREIEYHLRDYSSINKPSHLDFIHTKVLIHLRAVNVRRLASWMPIKPRAEKNAHAFSSYNSISG